MSFNILKDNLEKEELARQYSEGSSELYDCLIALWDNDIKTIGCCTGHNDKKGYKQYIGIKITNNKNIVKLLSLLNKEDICITFLKDSFSIKKNKKENIYINILNAIKKLNEINEVDTDRDILDAINFITKSPYDYVNIRFYYFQGSLNKYINTSDISLINKLKEKYKYTIINDKLPMYHFIVK